MNAKFLIYYLSFLLLIFFASCKTTKKTTEENKPIKSTENLVEPPTKETLPKTETKKVASEEDVKTLSQLLQEKLETAQITKKRAIQSSKLDTNSLAKEFIPILENIEDSIVVIQQKIKNSNPIYEDDVLEYIRLVERYGKQVDNINANLDKKQSKTWLTDVIFKSGKYKIADLTTEEENTLNDFVNDVIRFYKQEFDKIPDRKWTIKIQTIGHTDSDGFIQPYNQNELVKELIKGITDKVPSHEPEKRIFLNKRLSLFRGQSLNDFFKKKLLEQNIKAEIINEVIDLGEQLPNKTYVKEFRFDNGDNKSWRRIAISRFYVLCD